MTRGRLDGFGRRAKPTYEKFPLAVRDRVNAVLTIAAEGGRADIAKPLKGLGSGVLEIAVRHRTDAYRVVYVTEIAGTLWVIHAFKKKSSTGIKTPKMAVDLIRARLGRLKQELSK